MCMHNSRINNNWLQNILAHTFGRLPYLLYRKKLADYTRSHTCIFTCSTPARFHLYAHSKGMPYIANNFTPSALPIKVPGLCFSVYSEWLALVHPLRVLLACVFLLRCLLSFWYYCSTVLTDCSRVCLLQLKMVNSDYVEQRILFYCWLGKSFIQITRCLVKEGNATTKIGICQFIPRYEETEKISRMPGSGKAKC